MPTTRPCATRPSEPCRAQLDTRPETRLIGRESERRALLDAAVDRPSLILVEGPAGIGKSALVRDTVGDPALRGARALIGHCHPLREPFSLGPVVEALCGLAPHGLRRALSPVVGALRPVLPELEAILPAQPASMGDPRAERHRIFRALRELLAAVGPAVCVLEDMHWADESTLEFLAFLVADPPAELALVGTFRHEDLPSVSSLAALTTGLGTRMRHATIRVPALSVEEVGRLSCALFKTTSVSADLARHLHEQTAGIPFAVEEVVRLHHGQLERLDGWRTVEELDPMDVPPAVRQSIRARMASLSADAWLVTRAVAVLGVPADERLIGTVAGISPARTVTALSEALSGIVLREQAGGRYGFLHALAAQAVYDEIPRPERCRLHRRAAKAMKCAPELASLAQLAHHLKEGGSPAQWVRYAEAAAAAAIAIGDDRSAARLLEQALGATPLSRPARLRMALMLGDAAVFSPDPARAIDLLERIRDEEPMAVGARGDLRYRIARLRYQTGDTGPWREEMERAVEELRDQPALAARAMVTLAWPVVGQGDVTSDLTWLDRAVEAAVRSGDPTVRTGVATQRAAILVCVGDPRGWSAVDDIPRHGDSVEEKLELLRTYQNLTTTATAVGHFGRAASFLEAATRFADELPHVPSGPWQDSARARLDWRTGRWEGLEDRLGALSEHEIGGPALAIGNEMILAALLLTRGRIRDAEHHFQSIRGRAEARGWLSARTAAATGLTRILLGRGDADAAVDAATGGLEVIERKGIWIWGQELVPVAIEALLACGREREAAVLAQRFAAGIEGRDAPSARAASSFGGALVAAGDGRQGLAARRFARAEEIWSTLPAPYEAARARAARARCLFAADHRGGADLLLQALKAFDDLGAGREAAQARATLKRHDVPVPPRWRGGRRPYGKLLSPRETEVAHLAGMGQKNREIAETLFISQRTVETHVASALRKLGADSREALADALSSQLEPAGSAAPTNNRRSCSCCG